MLRAGNRDDFELDSLDAAYADLMGREVVDERFGSLGTIVEIHVDAR